MSISKIKNLRLSIKTQSLPLQLLVKAIFMILLFDLTLELHQIGKAHKS